eukprot:300100-Chlamydomonas_euryale.AAC.3
MASGKCGQCGAAGSVPGATGRPPAAPSGRCCPAHVGIQHAVMVGSGCCSGKGGRRCAAAAAARPFGYLQATGVLKDISAAGCAGAGW